MIDMGNTTRCTLLVDGSQTAVSRIGPREPSPVSLRPRRSLTDLLWVANTRHGPAGHWFVRVTVDIADHDHLATGPNATRYLVDHHVELPVEAPTEANLRDLQAIRDMVRALVEPGAAWTPAARAVLARTRFGLGLEGDIAAEGSGWSGFIGDLMVPLIQVVELRPPPAVRQSALPPDVPRSVEKPRQAVVRQRRLRQPRPGQALPVRARLGGSPIPDLTTVSPIASGRTAHECVLRTSKRSESPARTEAPRGIRWQAAPRAPRRSCPRLIPHGRFGPRRARTATPA